VLATSDPVWFDVLVVLHVACAVIGFGSVAVSGTYGAAARKADQPASVEETRRYFRSRGWSELLILPVPFLGLGALAARPSQGDLGDLWVVTGLVIWLMAAILLLGAVRPSERQIRADDREGWLSGGNRLMWAAAACDVLFVAALVLMIAQPR
jgi:hypothetical protein